MMGILANLSKNCACIYDTMRDNGVDHWWIKVTKGAIATTIIIENKDDDNEKIAGARDIYVNFAMMDKINSLKRLYCFIIIVLGDCQCLAGLCQK